MSVDPAADFSAAETCPADPARDYLTEACLIVLGAPLRVERHHLTALADVQRASRIDL